jgi:hypothetical protein
MKYTVEMGSGGVMYVKIGSGIQKLKRVGFTDTEHGHRLSLI